MYVYARFVDKFLRQTLTNQSKYWLGKKSDLHI